MDDSDVMQQASYCHDSKSEPNRLAEPFVTYADFNQALGVAALCRVVLEQFYGTRLKRVILYGSSARREANLDSDIDLLVVLARPFDYFKELRHIVDLLYPIQLESSQLISALPAAADEFDRGTQQFYRNIHKDGVAV